MWCDASLFSSPTQREAFRALSASAQLLDALDDAEPEAADLLRQLAVSDEADRIDVDGTMLELVRAAATRMLAELDSAARVAAADGDADRLLYTAELTQWLK